MSRNRPHPRAAFEGYYSKFSFPSGASLVLIICSVRNVPQHKKPHMVSITHYPSSGTSIWQKEFWDRTILMQRVSHNRDLYELKIPGVGSVQFHPDGSTTYDLDFNDFTFRAETRNRTTWKSVPRESWRREFSPEGLLSYLPLPLHWHVHSLGSDGNYALRMLSPVLPKLDSSGTARVHQEKNWGNSFPKGHIWIQARQEDRGVCLAGGEILGLRAYLIGYRSKNLNLDFKPPYSLQVLGFSPCFKVDINWENRTVFMDVCSFTSRLIISAQAPKGSFFTLGAPFPEGHREKALAESFQATVKCTVLQRSWIFGRWAEVESEVMERASLEFGGEYYQEKKTS